MWNITRKYQLEIIEFLVTVILAVISIAIPNVSLDATFIVASTGITISLATFILKNEINREINDKSELYNLLYQIEDKELRNHGYTFINETRDKLKKLGQGILILWADEVYSTAIMKMQQAQSGEQVFATHVSHEGMKYLYAWEDFKPLKNYFIENAKAIKRGVKIRRIFIMKKPAQLDDRAKEILRKHQEAKIEVNIVWIEDVMDKTVIEDFIIFGNSVVEIQEMPSKGRYHRLIVKRDTQEIDLYIKKFKKLKNFGSKFDDIEF